MSPGRRTPLSPWARALARTAFKVMTVEPGFGGQKYMDSCTEKIRRVRAAVTERKLRVDVEIDGGVTADNIGIPLAAGANVIVAGSAVFQGDIEENVHKLMAQMGNS